MSEPRISDLWQRMTLETPSRVPDGGGGADVSWSSIGDVWASLQPLTGAERQSADALSGEVTHVVWVRHRDDLTPVQRLRLGTRLFDIRSVLTAGYRRQWLRCLVEERIP